MTATIHHIYQAPPHVDTMRAEWAAERSRARQGRADSCLRIRYIVAFIVGMAIGQAAVDAMTAHNAAIVAGEAP